MISKEDLASGQGTRLDHAEFLCGRSFLTVKKGQRKLLTQTSEGGWRVPHLLVLEKGVIYFFNKSKECFKVVKILPDLLP